MKSVFKNIKKKLGGKEEEKLARSNSSSTKAKARKTTTNAAPRRSRIESADKKRQSVKRESIKKKGAGFGQRVKGGLTAADLLKPIATFHDTPANQRTQLFIYKLR